MTVRLIPGDCREALKSVEPASIDCVITDPPYGTTSLAWDRRVVGWLQLVRPLLKPHGSVWVFGSLRSLIETAPELGSWTIAQDLIWEKHNGSGAHADRFRRVHEQAMHLYPSNVAWDAVYKQPQFSSDARARTVKRRDKPQHWGGIGESNYRTEDGGERHMRSVLVVRSEHMRAEHPTQKPVALMAPIIEYSCPLGGVLLDPFAGSGTLGLAARATGRSAILIEADPAYLALAERRIADDAPLLGAAT